MNRAIPRIAARNLLRQRKRTMLLAGAIAFGVMIVTLINGFAGSFVKMSQKIFISDGWSCFVSGSEYTPSGRRMMIIAMTLQS